MVVVGLTKDPDRRVAMLVVMVVAHVPRFLLPLLRYDLNCRVGFNLTLIELGSDCLFGLLWQAYL